ncbi:MAG: Fic family protein [Bacteroidota bacterium]
MTDLKANIQLLVGYLNENPGHSSKEIYDASGIDKLISYATLKRVLQSLLEKQYITTSGKGKGTKYFLSKAYAILSEVDVEAYFKKEIDEREIHRFFNHDLIKGTLNKIDVFSPQELQQIEALQNIFKEKLSKLSNDVYRKDLERLAIDLSWKSSQIEGNTYSLLETENLLKDKLTAAGKTKDEAVMLLNHKDAIDFIISHADYIQPLTVRAIEDIHSLLIKELRVDRNIRTSSVGISGTNYRPIDNTFQIREALEEMCGLINLKENAFEKAFLALMLISYIQPFNDGNKRTARIIANAILLNNHICPLSFRTVDAGEYKKAMLVFYEKNNISAFKKIFVSQFKFAVETYF